MTTSYQDPLLTIKNLHCSFFLDEGVVQAVRGVDLEMAHAETLGVVGESGCGKSIMSLSVMNMIFPPGKIVSGQIHFRRSDKMVDLASYDANSKTMRAIRGGEIAVIFQEPMTSLSPVHTVGHQIVEAIMLHQQKGKKQAETHAVEMMEKVGIPSPAERFRQYPHEMSGGMRQRIMIAMALSCRPKLLIADEPTTALDVTTQGQILRLIKNLQDEYRMAVMLITHDLGVIAENADKVAVMYLGRVVEFADVRSLFQEPLHPYTQALMKSMPSTSGAHKAKLNVIEGSVPSPFMTVAGCPFHPRCPEAVKGLCDAEYVPKLTELKPNHKAACFVRSRELGHESA